MIYRVRTCCKKLVVLFMIGATLCLGITLHSSPDESTSNGEPHEPHEIKSSGIAHGKYYIELEVEEPEDNNAANLDAILDHPWSFNKDAAIAEREDMRQYFNPDNVISMTSDDASTGHLRRFYSSKNLNTDLIPPGLHRLLPKNFIFRNKHYHKCALVGNGGVLRNSSCGHAIDSSDFVIRCNFAPLKGYEKDVGTRADIVTFNPSIIDRYHHLARKRDEVKLAEDLRLYDNKYVLWVPVFSREQYVTLTIRTFLDFLETHLGNLRNVQLAFPGNVLERISDYWSSKGIEEDRISTGLLMYNMATALCDEIHIYGFYPFQEYKGKPIPYHYDHAADRVGDRFDVGHQHYHELPDEFAYLKKLHASGVVRLHVGECTGNDRL